MWLTGAIMVNRVTLGLALPLGNSASAGFRRTHATPPFQVVPVPGNSQSSNSEKDRGSYITFPLVVMESGYFADAHLGL